MTLTATRPPFGRTTSQFIEEADQFPDSDINFGAFLISHFRQRCENCSTTDTPQWRKGWYSEVLGRSVCLCNACGLKYHKNQFCSYCHYIYGKDHEENEEMNKDEWLSCRTCSRWCHTACEDKYGSSESLRGDGYCCPPCRGEVIPEIKPIGHITLKMKTEKRKKESNNHGSSKKRRYQIEAEDIAYVPGMAL